MNYVTSVVRPIHKFNAHDWSKFPTIKKSSEPLMFEAIWEDAHIYCVASSEGIVVYTEFISEPDWKMMVWSFPVKFTSHTDLLAKFHSVVQMIKTTNELNSDLVAHGFMLKQ